MGVGGLGLGVSDLMFEVYGLGSGVWGLGFGGWGLELSDECSRPRLFTTKQRRGKSRVWVGILWPISRLKTERPGGAGPITLQHFHNLAALLQALRDYRSPPSDANYHQLSRGDRPVVFDRLDLYHKSSDAGESQYRSRIRYRIECGWYPA